ncbi:DUF4240 domain-containing protein [Streptomyces sp. SID13726]|nr:DUF4240 domain-containing protein [Streptomyces sp. SID13726]
MDDVYFWALVASFDWERTGDDEAVLASAAQVLRGLPPQEILAFEDLLAAKLYALDTREHARWCYQGQADPDDGGRLHLRRRLPVRTLCRSGERKGIL